MYKKLKYMIYISIAIFFVLATVMLFNMSDRQTQKKQQEIEQQDFQQKTQEIERYNDSSSDANNSEINQRKENEGLTTDNLDFTPESEKKAEEKTDASDKKLLPGDKEIYYAVRSSKFTTINTKDEKFGLMATDDENALKVIAQILDKSNILLYVFNSENGKILWQQKLTNKDAKNIIPTELKIKENTINVSIEETQTKAEQNFLFEIDNTASTDTEFVYNLKSDDITQRDILFANKTKAKNVLSIKRFEVSNEPFHIVVYTDYKSSPSYSKNVKRIFYLYKEKGDMLRYCGQLFERSDAKDVRPKEFISLSQTDKATIIKYEGKSPLTRTLYNSKLVGPYAKYPAGNSLYLGAKTVAEQSNYDLEISEIY